MSTEKSQQKLFNHRPKKSAGARKRPVQHLSNQRRKSKPWGGKKFLNILFGFIKLRRNPFTFSKKRKNTKMLNIQNYISTQVLFIYIL